MFNSVCPYDGDFCDTKPANENIDVCSKAVSCHRHARYCHIVDKTLEASIVAVSRLIKNGIIFVNSEQLQQR